VGDGTTSVVLLAGEFLKQIKPFVEEGVHPRIIIRAFRKAMQLTTEKINSLAVKVCAAVVCLLPCFLYFYELVFLGLGEISAH
jgi:chaperonin GroEL (HSP60 family)